ncbi:MAG: nucleotidyl transferase AbiEii/AbiGii toxin family protein [Arcobacteraceae bacterium]|jgi:predicted nucleotidyltransferase component of viral defense system|nr:nucleotidyl transferase AbiEii/AbiGii toxin family protein [Arcobacteraceae bacterium]
MILHHDKETFNDLIETTASFLRIPAVFIEKDYWVTYILYKLSKSDYKETAIFKGGTSLSKAYKIIERFSEDIDLAVITDTLDGNAVKTLIKSIEKRLLDENFEEVTTPQTSKGSKFRKTVHQYPQIIEGNFGHANENLILELNSFAKPHPYLKKTITSYIYDFLNAQNDEAKELIADFQLEPFEVNVLDYKRTFCEKLSAIARASFESDKEYTQLKDKIRHFYDIYYLLQEEEIQAFIKRDEIIQMIANVREDDQKQFSAEWSNVKLHTTKIFQNPNILDDLASYYNSNFKTLVYADALPTIEDIKNEFQKLSWVLKEKDL